MEFRQMKYMLMVSKCNSITSAAEKLYVSQPALSAFIRKTEKSLGVRLFNRDTVPISLTYAGHKYIKAAEQIMSIYNRMLQQLSDIAKEETGSLTVGMPIIFHAFISSKMELMSCKQINGIELSIVVSNEEDLFRKLAQNKLDLIIMPSYEPFNEFVSLEITSENVVAIAKRGYIAEKILIGEDEHAKAIDIKSIADYPILVRSGQGTNGRLAEQMFALADVLPSNIRECPSYASMIRLASVGQGIAIVPNYVTKLISTEFPTAKYTINEPAEKVKIYALARKDTYFGKVAQSFIQLLREYV